MGGGVPAVHVQHHRADAQHRLGEAAGTAHHRAQPGGQLRPVDRQGDDIVGAEIEQPRPLARGELAGDGHHRQPAARRAQVAQHRGPGGGAGGRIDHRGIEAVVPGEVQRLLRLGRVVQGELLRVQQGDNVAGTGRVHGGEQEAHRKTCPVL